MNVRRNKGSTIHVEIKIVRDAHSQNTQQKFKLSGKIMEAWGRCEEKSVRNDFLINICDVHGHSVGEEAGLGSKSRGNPNSPHAFCIPVAIHHP